MRYKKIIVTPAGRREHLKILLNNLLRCREEFDRWDLWINTINNDDIKYIKELSEKYNFIKAIESEIAWDRSYSIHDFFRHYINVEEIYLRLDDDIVYIEEGSINRIFNERESDTEHFLLHGNVINNAIGSHIQQRIGNFTTKIGKAGYNCLDDTGWRNPIFAEYIHKVFLEKIKEGSSGDFKTDDWILFDNERCSINAISWRGDEFVKFNGIVGRDEEQWLSVDKPKELGRFNKIIGDTIFVHFAFETQRPHLKNTLLLEDYEKLSLFAMREKIISKVLEKNLYMYPGQLESHGNFYGEKYKKYVSSNTGLWQMPEEIADLLIFLSDKNIKTFLNIGTFNGLTFNLISNFLHDINNTLCVTIDPYFHNPVKDEKFEYLTATSDDFKNHVFDLVFIDGHHGYEYVTKDYNNVGRFAKYCVFHDIDDDNIRNHADNNGGVPRFWEEIKKDRKHNEFIQSDKSHNVMGIGVMYD